MVDYLEEYKALMARAVSVYDRLIELYTSSGIEDTESVRNAGEAGVYRKGLLEEIARPRRDITAEDTSPFIVATGHYLDNHWADYTTFPVAPSGSTEYPVTDPEKRRRLLELHTELQAVVDGIGNIYNAVRNRTVES